MQRTIFDFDVITGPASTRPAPKPASNPTPDPAPNPAPAAEKPLHPSAK